MDKKMEFAVFCIENLSRELNRSGAEVYRLLTEKSTILLSYILPNYESLHTQSREYIMEDLLDVMREEGLTV